MACLLGASAALNIRRWDFGVVPKERWLGRGCRMEELGGVSPVCVAGQTADAHRRAFALLTDAECSDAGCSVLRT